MAQSVPRFTLKSYQRRDEFAAGVQAQVQDAFGAKLSNMYEIQGLATDPVAQGRGYGGLLVNTVTNMVRRYMRPKLAPG